MTRVVRLLAGVVVVIGVGASPAAAQGRAPRAPSRLEVSFGAAIGGPALLGTASADLTRPNGTPLVEFRTDTRFGLGAGGEVGVVAFVSPRVGVEVAGAWVRQQIRTRITDDFERAPSVTLTQPLNRLTVEGAAVVVLAQGRRTGVFVRAGGGWMQEVADGATLAETGTTATIGVGMKYWWRDRPMGRGMGIGLRMDGRVLARSGGVTFGSRTWQFGPTGMVGLVFGF